MTDRLSLVLRYRRLLIVLMQLALVVLANQAAFLLRFDGHVPAWAREVSLRSLPVLLGLRLLFFLPFGLFEGFWRYTSIWDLRNIALSVLLSSAVFGSWVLSPFGPHPYPRSVLIVDALLLITALAGLRLSRRFYRELHRGGNTKRVLIYGAGDAGESLVRDMRHGSNYAYEPVAFVDDDPAKKGLRIHGVPVLGGRDALPAIIRRTRPGEILIAMPAADPAVIREVLRLVEPFKVHITTVPNLRDIIDGKVSLGQVRDLRTEDLLNRSPIDLDAAETRTLIRGRRVMVTGAGGSIGSELCRQIARFKPATLVLFERYENSLFTVENDLADRQLSRGVVAEIGDVTDSWRLEQVFAHHKPEIVFHAAAHKHVPLMEQSPCEAVKNNVFGTRLLAETAERHGVDRFIFISTDKAVNPTSVMGVTKRIAELLIQAQGQGSGTSFFTVRFGNVLGSNGSVVPRFLEQIKAGGPVTVTHPQMQRFFMLIPEAVQLVLHAAARGTAGATYVLEMGDQVKVLDMAKNLIRLSGFVPEGEIPIKFIGLRPGEKLFEELIGEDELVVASGIEKVIQVQPRRAPTPESLRGAASHLEGLAWSGLKRDVLRQLAALVPEFAPAVGIASPESGLTYVSSGQESEPELDAQPLRSAQMCPACHGNDVHRSRTRSVAERLKKSMTADRPFRCHACGWRGWLPVLAPIEESSVAAPAPDLGVLDSILEEHVAATPAAFSPRQLQ